MNTNILAKCIEELKTAAPDISYIRGALETLLEMSTPNLPAVSLNVPYIQPNDIRTMQPQRTESVADEEEFNETAAAYLGGPTGTVTESTTP